MARAVRARSDENVGPRVRANEPPDEHASEGARTPAPSLSAPGPRELRVRAVRGVPSKSVLNKAWNSENSEELHLVLWLHLKLYRLYNLHIN
ncbi:UDP-GalNAc:beta-1,3-N-acetylgalactosaminyltransferase 1 isoform X7 [Saccopteryx bilineata]|uniref:UDP-GalNAc:beta-1, 3-N-acetylgalactosaminyltransferase 1 isoform X7 n=1 Tax=Saccopteryx bilineata TaxID=59482 RepID=UPI00338DE174